MTKLNALKEAYANIEYLKDKQRTTKELSDLKAKIIKSREAAKDPDLSVAGQHKRNEEFKAKAIKEFLVEAKGKQSYHNAAIAEIKQGAKAIIAQELPVPSAEEQRLF